MDDPGNYRYIIDCMLNVPLLYWAAQVTGSDHYREIAAAHTATTLANSFRPDGSTYHTFFMNPDGTPKGGRTCQGYKDDSFWARGQAWGVYGSAIGYTYTHDQGIVGMQAALGLADNQIVRKVKVDDTDAAAIETAITECIEEGCNIIFADSFGHEDYMIQAAKEFKDVQFCHATGTKAHTEKLSNYHNAFASIYEGRYLAGVAAGMKLNEMIEAGEFTADQAKMGYVGAFTYAEVISGYTSFYLGAKSVCPSVTMDVTFTGSWYDEALEKEAANKLIAGGCKLISQHADSMGAPTACEQAGVPNVSYNGSTQSACPNTFIVSSRIDWTPYYEMVIKAVQDGTALDSDWTGTLKTGSVVLTDVNEKVAAKGTAEKIAEVTKQLEDGTLHVFDTSAFTVKGETLTSYMADVDTDADNAGDTEAIKDGYFHESEFRAAPYFNVQIDGINLLDQNFGS